jgi:SPFH domain / Band 7 family
MFIRYFKGEPSTHVIRYRNGKIAANGDGANFWYMPLNTSVAAVPIVSQEAQFLFTETTANYQEVSIQGTVTYRITDPLLVASRLDFTIDASTARFVSDDPDKLVQRIVNLVQGRTRSKVNALSLEAAITNVHNLAVDVFREVVDDESIAGLGIALESLHFTALKATPEMQKALEADHREGLQQRADQAIYARRAAAVSEERRIRQSELNTEVELENRRKDLVDTQARNNLTLAEAEAKADELKLNPYSAMPPQALLALALKEWAGNAGNIENLSITPDLLTKVASWVSAEKH